MFSIALTLTAKLMWIELQCQSLWVSMPLMLVSEVDAPVRLLDGFAQTTGVRKTMGWKLCLFGFIAYISEIFFGLVLMNAYICTWIGKLRYNLLHTFGKWLMEYFIFTTHFWIGTARRCWLWTDGIPSFGTVSCGCTVTNGLGCRYMSVWLM